MFSKLKHTRGRKNKSKKKNYEIKKKVDKNKTCVYKAGKRFRNQSRKDKFNSG